MTLWAQIDNGKPLMPEGDTAILVNPQTTVIRTPVGQGGCHVGSLVTELVCAGPPLWVQQTSDAAHQSRTGHVRARAGLPSSHAPPIRLAHGEIIGGTKHLVKCDFCVICKRSVPSNEVCHLMTPVASCGGERNEDVMNMRDRSREVFARLPPAFRRRVLHRLGRYAPWEAEFDFTPPTPGPGEEAGPPDFVGIGVQKAGTTWWYELLLEHPGIASPEGIHKERHFFDRFGSEPFRTQDIDRYHGWFPRRKGVLTGEWTPDYFTYAWTPPLLKQAAPDSRLLLMLRDPVERFRSGLAHQRRAGESAGANAINDAIQRGFYNRSLDRWQEHFDADSILIQQYERCAADPLTELGATHRFLGLPEVRPAELVVSRRIRSEPTSELDPDVKKRLVTIYEADVTALAKRLPDLDLTLWPNFSYLADMGTEPDESNSPVRRP